MATNRFDYPTVATATSSLVFDTAGHMASDSDELRFNDEMATSIGGSDYVLDYSALKYHFRFSFIVPRTKVAAEYDMADAKAFFLVVSRVNTFQWTDENSTVRTVRLMSNAVSFEPESGRWMRCTVELKQV